jgi:adenosine deaminase
LGSPADEVIHSRQRKFIEARTMERETKKPAAPLPLAELHCHLEGTVEPWLAQRLAARHGLDLSSIIDSNGNYIWSNFAEFLHAYDSMSEAIRTPEDYYDITYEYYRAGGQGGLIYSEVFLSPAHGMQHGMSYPTLVDSVSSAMRSAERDFGVVGRIIVTCVRHFGVEHAEETARLAERSPHPMVVGFGMAGDENHGAPKDFQRAFKIARGAGLKTTAHAGELAGPQSVRDAIRDLDVLRIGHGVRASEDPALEHELADRQIPLELCPSSNVALGLYPSIAKHPIGRMAESGLMVTISTDDPPFMHTSIRFEYERVAQAHGLDRANMLAFTTRAITAAFCDDQTKQSLRQRVSKWEATVQ